ncbi:MAG: 40S ribosomal protein S21 [Chaenotheca gracillima]|nr:MAG: 40S ribosomal protein S21 [Chaenotheca gracillima]
MSQPRGGKNRGGGGTAGGGGRDRGGPTPSRGQGRGRGGGGFHGAQKSQDLRGQKQNETGSSSRNSTPPPRQGGFFAGKAENAASQPRRDGQTINNRSGRGSDDKPFVPTSGQKQKDSGDLTGWLNALKKNREREREHAIANNLVDDPNKQRRLEDAITFVGTCKDMCPEFERAERIVWQAVDTCEKVTGEDGTLIWDEMKMVKRFRRSAAGDEAQLPSDVRPPAILKNTLDYLIKDVVGGPQPLAKVHNFLWDRTRAIRNDFSIQNLQGFRTPNLLVAIDCYEIIARFHVHALHELSSPDVDDTNFTAHNEREQLNKTLLTLMELYDLCAHRKVNCTNEAEFRAYHIILHLHDQNVERETMNFSKERPELYEHPRIQVALQLYAAAGNVYDTYGPLKPEGTNTIAQNDFSKYFRLVRSNRVSYTMACIAEVHFNHIRRHALMALRNAYRSPATKQDCTISHLTELLGFDNDTLTQEFCEDCGMTVSKKDDGQHFLVLNIGGEQVGNGPAKQPFSRKLVEHKRQNRVLPDVIYGLTVRQARAAGNLSGNVAKPPSSLGTSGLSAHAQPFQPAGSIGGSSTTSAFGAPSQRSPQAPVANMVPATWQSSTTQFGSSPAFGETPKFGAPSGQTQPPSLFSNPPSNNPPAHSFGGDSPFSEKASFGAPSTQAPSLFSKRPSEKPPSTSPGNNSPFSAKQDSSGPSWMQSPSSFTEQNGRDFSSGQPSKTPPQSENSLFGVPSDNRSTASFSESSPQNIPPSTSSDKASQPKQSSSPSNPFASTSAPFYDFTSKAPSSQAPPKEASKPASKSPSLFVTGDSDEDGEEDASEKVVSSTADKLLQGSKPSETAPAFQFTPPTPRSDNFQAEAKPSSPFSFPQSSGQGQQSTSFASPFTKPASTSQSTSPFQAPSSPPIQSPSNLFQPSPATNPFQPSVNTFQAPSTSTPTKPAFEVKPQSKEPSSDSSSSSPPSQTQQSPRQPQPTPPSNRPSRSPPPQAGPRSILKKPRSPSPLQNEILPTPEAETPEAEKKPKEIPEEFASAYLTGEGGLLEQLVDFITPDIIASAMDEFEKERAAEYRQRKVMERFFYRWKSIAHERSLIRRGRSRRERMSALITEQRKKKRKSDSSVASEMEIPVAKRLLEGKLSGFKGSRGHHRSRTVDGTSKFARSSPLSPTPSDSTSLRRSITSSHSPGFNSSTLRHTSFLSGNSIVKPSSSIGNRSTIPRGNAHDNIKSDYWRLKAAGLRTLPNGVTEPLSLSKGGLKRKTTTDAVSEAEPPKKSIKARPLQRPSARSERPSPIGHGVAGGSPNGVNGHSQASPPATEASPPFDDEDEELFAQLRGLNKALDDGIEFYRGELEEESRRSSMESGRGDESSDNTEAFWQSVTQDIDPQFQSSANGRRK